MTAIPKPEERIYTIEDIYNLPEGVRAELIDGQIYYFAAPSIEHQALITELITAINTHLKKSGGSCRVFTAPAVYLYEDEKTYVEPDIVVICDPQKIDKKGCIGAPDWIIEIASPSNSNHDYIVKLKKYMAAGVKEYWIVNPEAETILIYRSDSSKITGYRTFSDTVPSGILEGFSIDFSQLNI